MREPIVISADGNTELGDGSQTIVSTKVVHLVGAGWTGNIAVQGKAKGAPAAAYTAVAYRDMGSPDTSSTAAITATKLISIDCAGLDIRLVTSGFAAGTMTLYVVDLLG